MESGVSDTVLTKHATRLSNAQELVHADRARSPKLVLERLRVSVQVDVVIHTLLFGQLKMDKVVND